MVIPSENKKILQNLERYRHYSYERPAFLAPRVDLTSYPAAKLVLERPDEFRVSWADGLGFLMGKGGREFMLAGDSPFHAGQKRLMREALYGEKWHQEIKQFYEATTLKLLRQKTRKIAGVKQVDITREYVLLQV